MLRLATAETAVPAALPRSRIVAKPVARLPGSAALATPASRLYETRSFRATVLCKAEPPKDAAKDDDKDKDKDKAETPKSRGAEKRAKFLAGVKIPDESEATKKGVN